MDADDIINVAKKTVDAIMNFIQDGLQTVVKTGVKHIVPTFFIAHMDDNGKVDIRVDDNMVVMNADCNVYSNRVEYVRNMAKRMFKAREIPLAIGFVFEAWQSHNTEGKLPSKADDRREVVAIMVMGLGHYCVGNQYPLYRDNDENITIGKGFGVDSKFYSPLFVEFYTQFADCYRERRK